jgi:hypothetical protein
MTFRERLVELRACDESREWVGNKTIEEAWKTCENPQWMLWILIKTDFDLIDPVCDMAEGVLHLVPEDKRLVCSNAISAARRRASKDELKAAVDAAFDIAYDTVSGNGRDAISFYSSYAARSAYCAARTASAWARAAAFRTYDDAAAKAAANSAADYAYCTYSYAAAATIFFKERKIQCDILRKYFTIDQVKEAFNKLVA